jgi:hypothetical protein
MQDMTRSLLAVFLGAAMTFVSCWQPTSLVRVHNVVASPLKNRIPPPDPNMYSSVRDARDWHNPYLMVQAKRIVDARPISAAMEAVPMSPGDVVAYLEKLPSRAWPYGLVVVVQENSLHNPGDNAPIKRNREELVGLLERAGIKVDPWPS